MKKTLFLVSLFIIIGNLQTSYAQNIAQINTIMTKYMPLWAQSCGELSDEDSSTSMVVATLNRSYLDSIFYKDYFGMKSLFYLPNHEVVSYFSNGKEEEAENKEYILYRGKNLSILTGNAEKVPMNTEIMRTIIGRYAIDDAIPIIVFQPFTDDGCGKLLICYLIKDRVASFIDQDNSCIN